MVLNFNGEQLQWFELQGGGGSKGAAAQKCLSGTQEGTCSGGAGTLRPGLALLRAWAELSMVGAGVRQGQRREGMATPP